MTKHPPKGVVVLWTAMFNGENYKVPKTDADEKMAVYIPRAEVATLDVSAPHVHVISFPDCEIKSPAESWRERLGMKQWTCALRLLTIIRKHIKHSKSVSNGYIFPV
jgi:hypothetical protein